ncbi:MAG: NAD synthetase [Hyphomonas sp.]|uniref:hypothetical protein n=1 Tax=Hyphomonas sp. TaxID=87 RepID=UPI001DAC11E5|nr:hypothetical protein [Hyphomonas sp.]MBA4228689.1 NAD synthetase [Hyphomonas sp.]
MNWQYDPQINPLDFEGFVYLITSPSGKGYIGKKSVWTRKGRGKKQTTSESKWRDYWSSSKELQADVKAQGKEGWTRTILCWCRDKASLTYCEQREQFAHNVLGASLPDGSPAYYNRNIAGRFYRAPDAI